MRESVCALQEGIYAIDPSPLEMASQILSSVFGIFFAASRHHLSPAELSAPERKRHFESSSRTIGSMRRMMNATAAAAHNGKSPAITNTGR